MSVIGDRKNYDMFRFYQGEESNPFDNEKQNAQHQFWFYESCFEDLFERYSSSEWYSFFDDYGMGKDFMKILSSEDYERPSDEKKLPVFDLWLKYFFKFKLYPEYGGENTDKELYFSFDRMS